MESRAEKRRFYCEILGISEMASQKVAKQAYHYLAQQYHPDKNAGDDLAKFRFQQINEAYHYLSTHRFQEEKADSNDVYERPQKLPLGWANQVIRASAVSAIAFVIGSYAHPFHHSELVVQKPAVDNSRTIASVEQPEEHLKSVLCQDPKLRSDLSSLLATPHLPKPDELQFSKTISEKDRNDFKLLAKQLSQQFDQRMNAISDMAGSIYDFCRIYKTESP